MRTINLFILFISISVGIYSQDLMPDGSHEHDGLFIRAHTGIGVTSWKSSHDNKNGGAAAFRLQAGWAVANDLVIYGEYGITSVLVQYVSILGNQSGFSSHLDIRDIGGGAAYYFMPVNISISISLFSAISSYGFAGTRQADSEPGFGFLVSIGKEWWIGKQWGMGVTLYYSAAGMNDHAKFNNKDIETNSIGALFTVSFN